MSNYKFGITKSNCTVRTQCVTGHFATPNTSSERVFVRLVSFSFKTCVLVVAGYNVMWICEVHAVQTGPHRGPYKGRRCIHFSRNVNTLCSPPRVCGLLTEQNGNVTIWRQCPEFINRIEADNDGVENGIPGVKGIGWHIIGVAVPGKGEACTERDITWFLLHLRAALSRKMATEFLMRGSPDLWCQWWLPRDSIL